MQLSNELLKNSTVCLNPLFNTSRCCLSLTKMALLWLDVTRKRNPKKVSGYLKKLSQCITYIISGCPNVTFILVYTLPGNKNCITQLL